MGGACSPVDKSCVFPLEDVIAEGEWSSMNKHRKRSIRRPVDTFRAREYPLRVDLVDQVPNGPVSPPIPLFSELSGVKVLVCEELLNVAPNFLGISVLGHLPK